MFAIETRAEAPAAGSTAKPAVSWGRLTPRHAIRDEVLRVRGPPGSSFTRRRVQRAGRVTAVTPVPTLAADVAADWQGTQMKTKSPQESREEVFKRSLCTKDACWVQSLGSDASSHYSFWIFYSKFICTVKLHDRLDLCTSLPLFFSTCTPIVPTSTGCTLKANNDRCI